MFNYIGNILNDIPEDMRVESAKPAAHNISDIAEDATKLSQNNADIFHHLFAQLLHLSNQALPHIHWQYHSCELYW